MCLFKKRIPNPKYKPSWKNSFNPPKCTDERLRYIEVDCGICSECRKKKRREWSIRIKEELKDNPTAIFFTGTFSPERLKKLQEKYNIKDNNEIATKELRLFLERIRKETGKSIRHWVVTELGEDNGRIHIHGIFISRELSKYEMLGLLWSKWTGGYKYYGKYCNNRTANYITKYMLKENKNNREFKPKVLCTKGIGKQYFEKKENKRRHVYIPKSKFRRTIESYRNERGIEQALPTYYRMKLWTEQEREWLRLEKEEDGIKWLKKSKYSVKTEEEQKTFQILLKQAQEEEAKLYGITEEYIEKIRKRNKRERRKKYIKNLKNDKEREKRTKRRNKLIKNLLL